jgi:CRISPR system Cascade subunit CasD
MAEPILLLRLEAPLQSWGTRSRWDVRDSAPEPTKSGVLGLLGCALGLSRRHPRLEELDGALRFAVRADRPGIMATDYHTVTGRHRMANARLKTDEYTVQSYRDYLHDAAFLVALAGGADLLGSLARALRSPRWPLFLGRKSCVPTRPVLEGLTTTYASLEEAVGRTPWSAPSDPRTRRAIARSFEPAAAPPAMREWTGADTWEARGPAHELTAWVEDPAGESERQDALRTNDLRFYDFRRARRIQVPLHGLEVLSS